MCISRLIRVDQGIDADFFVLIQPGHFYIAIFALAFAGDCAQYCSKHRKIRVRRSLRRPFLALPIVIPGLSLVFKQHKL
jgi:hypothetical protein